MKIKAVFNEKDERQVTYIKYLKRTFPDVITEEKPDLYYVVGGDGAMLYAHKHFGHTGKPFFGKGMGTLNFIMNNYKNDFEILDGLLEETIVPEIIQTEKIKVTVVREKSGREEKETTREAINDIVIGANIMDYHKFEINSDNGSFDDFNYKGAGLCISTPLGSTAYNVNNNGKVLPPISELWGITSIVGDYRVDEIMSPQRIEIVIKSERSNPILYIDGTATQIPLCKGDKIVLEKIEKRFNLAFIDLEEFYKKRVNLIQQKR